MRELRLAVGARERASLEAGSAIVLPLGDVGRTLPRTATGMRFDSVVVALRGGVVRAFANVCPHQAVALDARAPDPDTELLSIDRKHLVCHSHGALFRLDGGECVSGPCLGASLEALPARVDPSDGAIFVTLRE